VSSLAILIDFGSTFTKITAVDLAKAEVIGRSQAPSTVLTDVREGLLQGLENLHERHALFNAVPKDLSVLNGKVVPGTLYPTPLTLQPWCSSTGGPVQPGDAGCS